MCVTRHNSITHESVILVSYTAFSNPNPFTSGEGKGVTVTGCVQNVLIEAYLEHKYIIFSMKKFLMFICTVLSQDDKN